MGGGEGRGSRKNDMHLNSLPLVEALDSDFDVDFDFTFDKVFYIDGCTSRSCLHIMLAAFCNRGRIPWRRLG